MQTLESALVLDQIASDIADYYTDTLKQHGATPRGVDWSCRPTQELRFVQLMRLCQLDDAIALNDVGCGYGALREFLNRRHRGTRIDYYGVDMAAGMVEAARLRCRHLPHTRFDTASAALRLADYSVASGIFNIKLHHSETAWEAWVAHNLQALHSASRIGFAVNFLSPPPSGKCSLQALYRPPVEYWTSYCERALQAEVELVSGYGMREYTLLVRRR